METQKQLNIVQQHDINDLNNYIGYAEKLFKSNFKNFKYLFSKNCSKKVKNIATYYHRMHNGGIEKVLSLLTKIWVNLGYNVILITKEITENDYCIDPRVVRVVVDKSNFKKRNYDLKNILIKYSIDTFVDNCSLGYDLNDYIIAKSLNINYILYSHLTLNYFLFAHNLTKLEEFIKLVSLSDASIFINEFDAHFMKTFSNKCYVIDNPFVLAKKQYKVKDLDNKKSVIWVGRANDSIKNINCLIPICKILKKNNEKVKFLIVGEINNKFRKKVKFNKLDDYFIFYGYANDVSSLYLKSALFLLTSHFETYSMVMLEAFNYSKPVVMFDLPYLPLSKSKGVISIEHENYDMMASTIINLIHNNHKINKLGSYNYEFAKKLYHNSNISDKWNDILNGLHNNIFSSENCDILFQNLELYKRISNKYKNNTGIIYKFIKKILTHI